MLATTRSIQVSAPETKGSCTNPTRGSSKTHIPWCLYGDITLIAFMRFAGACKFCYSRTTTLGGSQGVGLAPRLRGGSAAYSLGSRSLRFGFSERRRSHNPANSCTRCYGGGEGEGQQAAT